jgi:Family of unknown function (DUF6263)
MIFLPIIAFLILSCMNQSNSGRNYGGLNENKVYRLHLNPGAGSEYFYNISNESQVNLEVNGKKANNQNKSTIRVHFNINKDSSRNFLMEMKYEKIHVYSKNGDKEMDLDADQGVASIDPVEKMLGYLKTADIKAVISPSGEVKSVSGYKELGAKIMGSVNSSDAYARNIMQSQWDQMVGEGMIKNNMTRLFKIFPDSAVQVGDKWNLNSRQSVGLGINSQTLYILKKIDSGLATIVSTAEINGDSTSTKYMGYDVTTDITGDGRGEYEIDINSGMLLKASMTINATGTIQMMGREIPVAIEVTIKMNGKKVE